MVTFLALAGLVAVIATFIIVFQMWNPWFLRTEVAYYRKNLETQLSLNSVQAKKIADREAEFLRQIRVYGDQLNEKNLLIANLRGQLADLRLRVDRDEKTIKRLGVFIEGREIVIDNLIAAEASAREEMKAKDELLKLAQPKAIKKRKK